MIDPLMLIRLTHTPASCRSKVIGDGLMMKIGNKTFRDRRGAAQRILGQIRANGCLPRYANFKTVRKLKEAGAISFCDGRYWLGQAPSLQREPGSL